MKSLVKNQQLLSIFLLTGVLSISTSLSLVQNTTAATQKNSASNITTKGELISDRRSNDDNSDRRSNDDNSDRRSNDDNSDRRRGGENRGTSNQLPDRVANAVLADLSKQTRLSARQLQVTQYSRQTWSDACLGLAKPGEMCSQAVVEGWRVVVSNGQQNWVYRTDRNGRLLRLEARNTANTPNMPANVANAVLRDAAQRLNLSSSQLKIVKTERRNWSDGCLGLGRPQDQCAAVVTPGWLVTVEGRQQRLVYRTSDRGRAIVFDPTASPVVDGSIKPIQIPTSQLPSTLERGTVFRAISSGGFAGRTYETTLFNNGRVVRVLIASNGNKLQPQTYQISRQQMIQFQQLLQQEEFNQFNGLSYPVNQGAADFINITLSSRTATTIYTDINQNLLPRPLKAVIKAWNQIAINPQR
ncbi:hypothetical protein C7B70_17250 [Chlorogloea sp. CCALA 695]|nr:hypothetical protein C7B70_17250 [Chlorogloea sp. CCALA 695]